jgi:hypothetical protein
MNTSTHVLPFAPRSDTALENASMGKAGHAYKGRRGTHGAELLEEKLFYSV